MITEINKRKCLYCYKEYTSGRSDKKFCTSTCKAKNHEQQKANEVTTILYIRESQAKKTGLIRKILGWIW